MANKTIFLRACKKVEDNKKSYEEKAQETRKHSARLAEMQKYVDLSEEKRKLLLDLVLHGRSSDSDESLLDKGVIIYAQYLNVIDQIEQDLKAHGIETYVIQGKTKQEKRGEIAQEFRGDPHSKVVLISDAAGESLSLHSTNEIIMVNVNTKYQQIIGRIARNFGKFEREGRKFYIHYLIVDETLDVYKPILLSSKKQLEEDILHADMINLKETGSFDAQVLKELRKELLWKTKKKKKNNLGDK